MFDLPPDPFSVEGRNELIEQQREVIALWEAEYKLCNEVMGEELKFMGTSQAAKDIERMAEVWGGKDALINFVSFPLLPLLESFNPYEVEADCVIVSLFLHQWGFVRLSSIVSFDRASLSILISSPSFSVLRNRHGRLSRQHDIT